MNNQNLLIYDFKKLFEILVEIQEEMNFKINYVSRENLNEFFIDNAENYLVLTKVKIPKIQNQLLVDKLPIKFSKLFEKINIEFLKLKFTYQSKIIINKYTIDINSREMKSKNSILKLTEKECDIIVYLLKFKNPVSINQLQLNVWGHQSKLETHTVETHIYRLRKKISKSFDDIDFIESKKNGYQII
jgi:hypothetical protein